MKPRVPPPLLALIAALIMWVLHRSLPIAQGIVAPWNRPGIIAAALGVAIVVSAFRRFQRVQTTVNPLHPEKATQLVTDGVFGISRNPMYLGLTLILIGWAIWLGSLSVWLIPLLFPFAITYVQIIPEERALSQLFGTQYLAYRHDVSRWIGRRTQNRAQGAS